MKEGETFFVAQESAANPISWLIEQGSGYLNDFASAGVPGIEEDRLTSTHERNGTDSKRALRSRRPSLPCLLQLGMNVWRNVWHGSWLRQVATERQDHYFSPASQRDAEEDIDSGKGM
ncbi:hypothetical protein P3T76_001795 [Phytophthora citrophthora]|uniref:Uncharacterized protein n=1 Tax=Phytophthora citrophthora TaxID=4793 RepID=A0AAD9GWZ3_9STRA|nr:hypothetical protein P3T76_001795 [Phytophthora citrophthora]